MNESTDSTFSYDHFDMRKYLAGIFRNKIIILGCIIVSVLIALFYLWQTTPLYKVQASLVIMDEKKGEGVSVSLKELDFLDDQKIVENEAEILKSESIISKVVKQLRLDIAYFRVINPLKQQQLFYTSPVYATIIKSSSALYKNALDVSLVDQQRYKLLNGKRFYLFGDTVVQNGFKVVINKSPLFVMEPGQLFRIKVFPVNEVTQNIKSDISIAAPGKNSSVLNIAMLHPSPQKGVEIIRGIIAEYNRVNTAEKQIRTDTILALIEERLSLIANQLKKFDLSEQNFKIEQGITHLSDDSKMFLDNVKLTDQQLSETTAKLALLNDLERYVLHSNGGVAPPGLGDNDPLLVSNVNQLNQLELERKTLESTTGKQHPLLKVNLKQIKDVKNNIIKNLQLRKKDLTGRLAELKNTKRNIDADISSVPLNERNLLEILRERNVRENIYTYLLQKREEASIKDVSVFQKMRQIDIPYSSAKPVKPNKLVVFAGAVFIGFLLPVFSLNIKKQLNNKILSRQKIEKLTGLRVIGQISRSPHFEYTAFQKEPTVIAEQFRHLRTNISRQIHSSEHSHICLVTSSKQGEGKSFISINLAISFSLLGKKTLLIDADLRNPKLMGILNLPENRNLIDELRTDSPDISKVIVAHPEHMNLDLITSGALGEMSSELWGGDLTRFFALLRTRYQYIFINTPPFRIFTDALQIEKYADASIFVIRHNFTKTDDLEHISKSIAQNYFKRPSVVFNNVPLLQLYDKKMIRGLHFRY